jgi:tRNA-splicing ligase RtcB
METGSALLVGTATAMAETFGSTAHGAGRVLSRGEAKRRVKGAAPARTRRGRGTRKTAAKARKKTTRKRASGGRRR